MWFAWAFCTFSLVIHFHINLNIQNSWPHWLSTYRWQFCTSNHFHVKWSTNPRVNSILPTAIISLCAFPGRFQSRDFLFANLAAPIISYRLFSNLRCARRTTVIHPGNCSPALVGFNRPIISQILLLEFSCANLAAPIAQDHLFSKL